MDKASKAIRRSGVRLRSLSSGHGSLQMVISQLGEIRTSFKAFAQAQATASEDLLRWSGGNHENRAIEETFVHLAELSLLWSEVQRDFADELKEYRTQYELVLEGERHVTHAREILAAREQHEGKLRKELKKASKKAPAEEVRLLKEKLSQAERSRDLAHQEVVERVGENEAVKMIRVKEGLLKLSGAYCELAQKCLVIFNAHQNIASQLPDVHERDLHDVKYTGSGSARKFVQEAKERLRSYRRNSISQKPAIPRDPPPPYTPSDEHLNDLSSNTVHSGTSNTSHRMPYNPNSSSLSEPSAPKASMSSIDSPEPMSHNGGPNLTHSASYSNGSQNHSTTPDASVSSVPPVTLQNPSSHFYPDHPRSSRPTLFSASKSPSLPEEPHPPHSPHSNSAPNLVEESPGVQVMRYPPLSIIDNSSFNESSFHPDTSSSSPNLACSRQPKTSTPDNSPPYNPYYDWLPVESNVKEINGRFSLENKDVPPTIISKSEERGNSHFLMTAPSVRPRMNRNFSVEDDSDEVETGEEGISGALRKSSVR
ncbi:uncharacterized protein [Panulirus ornatus]|uniref:uncharacterized protein n=1 Tax=Panulirus ornatus TaxID=150431 RepID=UPI003A872ABF